MGQVSPLPSEHPKWEAFKRSFKQSNYVTDFWNWFLTLLSKSAELVLFGSILYSSYQLIPGVPTVPATIDAFLFLVQQAALDIGGLGLLKLAKRAGLPRESFPMRVGVTLVVLMILNVVVATLKHALPIVPESVFVVIETVLLIARAVMAVLFGHAIHALREEYSESVITIKEASELQAQVEQLSRELSLARQSFHQELSQHVMRARESIHQELSRELSQTRQSFHQELSHLQQSFHDELSSGLSPLQETFHQYQSVLMLVAQMEASLHALPEMHAKVEQMERSTMEEFRQVKISLQQQALRTSTEAERPPLRMLPRPQGKAQEGQPSAREHPSDDHSSPDPSPEKFDARAFVFDCLTTNPTLKLSELSQLAQSRQQELSQPTASRYRKQFFQERESSSMKGESSAASVKARRESSTVKGESSSDERRVAGE